jgi:hypothetical protein
MPSVLPATIEVQHQVYEYTGTTDARGNKVGALADPVTRLVISFYRLGWESPRHDPISLDYEARTITDLLMLVPDPNIYKKLDRVLIPSGSDWVAYEVQNITISWSEGFTWRRYAPLLGGEVHIRRVQ